MNYLYEEDCSDKKQFGYLCYRVYGYGSAAVVFKIRWGKLSELY